MPLLSLIRMSMWWNGIINSNQICTLMSLITALDCSKKNCFFLGQLSCHLVMLLFCCQCSRWGFCCICCRFVFWVCQSSFEHLMKLQSRALLTSVVKLWHWAARFRDVRKKHVCVHSTLAFSSRQAVLLQLSGHSVSKISRSLLLHHPIQSCSPS